MCRLGGGSVLLCCGMLYNTPTFNYEIKFIYANPTYLTEMLLFFSSPAFGLANTI